MHDDPAYVDPAQAGNRSSVLVLRMEPAGYTVAFVRALRAAWRGCVDVVFVSPSLTQQWTLGQSDCDITILPAGTARSLAALRQHIITRSPALIHTPGWGSPQSVMAILTGSARGIPVTVDLDTWVESPSRWRGALKRKLFDHVTHFAPAGIQQANYLRKYGIAQDRITPVNMTVDVAGIRRNIAAGGHNARIRFRERYGIPMGAVVALFVGRLVDVKGVDTLLAAWQEVSVRHSDARLAFVGDGPLRECINEVAGADAKIHLVGRMSESDVWQAYAASDFFVGSSRVEPWGLVVNEAMAAGLPTIITDRYGCGADLVMNGETGFIVCADSPSSLADVIGILVRDIKLRKKMASNAANVISGWTIEAQAKKTVDIWMRELIRR